MIEQWYSTYADELTRAIRSRGFTPEDAEDIVSQVFLEAIKRQPSAIAPRAWLYTVARSRMIDRKRAEARRHSTPLEEWHGVVEAPEAEESGVQRALLLLPSNQHFVVAARFVHDIAIADLAAQMGTTPNAIKALQHRGLENMARGNRAPPRYSLSHERNWTEAEIARLRLGVDQGWDYQTIGKWLGRSSEGIRVKAKKLGATMYQTHPTADKVARTLGLGCAKTITYWHELGWLRATRSSDRPHANWYIRWADVWAFCENPSYWMAWQPERITDVARRTWAVELRKGQPRWLKPSEVAKRYHVTRGVVCVWIMKFGLKATHYQHWWINERNLEDWVPPYARPRTYGWGHPRKDEWSKKR